MNFNDYRKETSSKVKDNSIKKGFKKMANMYKTFKLKMDIAVKGVQKTFQSHLEDEYRKRGLERTPKSLDEQFKEKYGHAIYRNIDRDNPVFQSKVKVLTHVRQETRKEMFSAASVQKEQSKEKVEEGKTIDLTAPRRRFGDPVTPELQKERDEKKEKDKELYGEIETRSIDLTRPRRRFGDPVPPELQKEIDERKAKEQKEHEEKYGKIETRTVSKTRKRFEGLSDKEERALRMKPYSDRIMKRWKQDLELKEIEKTGDMEKYNQKKAEFAGFESFDEMEKAQEKAFQEERQKKWERDEYLRKYGTFEELHPWWK